MDFNKNNLLIGGAIVLLFLVGLYSLSRSGANVSEEKIKDTAAVPQASPPEVVLSEENGQVVETPNNNKKMNHLITLKTSAGEIQFMTYDEDAPKTVENFITLANKGYYEGIPFHRVIDGFMIQGGDPLCKAGAAGMCGTGGPGYKFADELNPATQSYKDGYQKGVVAMANAGPNTNGSQFFIMLQNTSLPRNYSIFGKVVRGQEVVDAIGKVETDVNDRPLTPVVIQSVMVGDYVQ